MNLRYVLLFAVAAIPIVVLEHLKRVPLALLAAVFLAHAILSLVTCRQARSTVRDLFSALLLLGCFAASCIFIVSSLALLVVRPVTPEGYGVMPIGQLFVGFVGGSLLAACLAFYGALRPAVRDRRRERVLLHGIGGVILIVAVIVWVRD